MKPVDAGSGGPAGEPPYRFGDVIVDAAAHTLLRDGEPAPVEPKAFAVLLVLLRRAGELVARDELLDAVWGHRHVTPGVLTRAIAQLRQILGDDFHHPRYIQTQHALGYRFIGELEPDPVVGITPAQDDAAPAARPGPSRDPAPTETDDGSQDGVAQPSLNEPADDVGPSRARITPQAERPVPSRGRRAADGMRRRWPWLGAAALGLVLAVSAWQWLHVASPSRRPAEASIAVLPFTTLSNTRDDGYFAEGLAVEMHDALAGVPGLEVVAARRAATDGGSDIDVKTLGRRLGVATVLDANVRRDGSRVRISANLSDTRTGFTLWAGSYDRDTADVFAVQSEIANEVVQALLGMLPGSGRSLSQRLTPTHDVIAYDAYLKGLQRLQELGSDNRLETAIGFFREALEADPAFARAQAGICRAEIARFEAARDAEAFQRAQAACIRASSMDPGLREVTLALGEMYRVRGDFARAITQYTKALDDIALRPLAYVGLARTEGARGRSTQALDYFSRALKLRPADANIHRELGYFHYLSGDLPAAIEAFATATRLQPDDEQLWSSLGGLYLASGDAGNAGDAFQRSLSIKPSYAALSNFGSLKYESGDYAGAADLFRRATELDPEDFRIWGNLGDALSAIPGGAPRAREPYRQAALKAENYVGIKPDAQALVQLAWYRANLGEGGAARELLARAESMPGQRGEVAFWGAQVLALTGDIAGARRRVAQALAADIPEQRIRASPLLRNVGGGGQTASPGSAPLR